MVFWYLKTYKGVLGKDNLGEHISLPVTALFFYFPLVTKMFGILTINEHDTHLLLLSIYLDKEHLRSMICLGTSSGYRTQSTN